MCVPGSQAALVDLRIPQVEISPTDDPEDEPEIELDDDPEHAAALDTSKIPLLVTVAQVIPPTQLTSACTFATLATSSSATTLDTFIAHSALPT